MWRLEKQQKSEMNKGQTTAFKRCSTASEAKRFKRILHEFTLLKERFIKAETLAEGASTIRDFIEAFSNPLLEGDEVDLLFLKDQLTNDQLYLIGQKIAAIELKLLDPKHSISELIKMIINDEEVLEPADAGGRQFREGLGKILKRKEIVEKIQRDSSPQKEDGSIKLVQEVHQRFYDSYQAFWNLGKVNSTNLVKAFETVAKKRQNDAHVEKLDVYLSENTKIAQPEVPQPYFVKQFPFVSSVGQNQELMLSQSMKGVTKSQRQVTMRSTSSYKINSQKNKFVSNHFSPRHIKIALDGWTSQREDRLGSEESEIKNIAMRHKLQATQQLKSVRQKPSLIGRKNPLIRPEISVANRSNEIKQDLVLKSVAILEQGSVIQRNKLLLEHVMLERHKDQMAAKQSFNDSNFKGQTQPRRPPSKLQIDNDYIGANSVSTRIDQASRLDNLPEDTDNKMVFIKNEKMIYF
ncbi:hypothetical protein FGO68_gene10707 [Halteria grandinella]|uniref:Uncharacterized protein n=1 Tax=Halteria grandinella TaxID=5974 RepID=A0A8J8NE64_HALGN|nr:hypothetical protein FGO68_gene10707 [Halteria grandinella]